VAHLPIAIVGAAGFANTLAVVVLQPLVTQRTASVPRSRLLAFGAGALGLCWLLTAAATLLPGGRCRRAR
jgi:hypothetical protein